MGDWGRLTTLLFISFTPSTALCSILQRHVKTLLGGWGEEKMRKGRVKEKEGKEKELG